MSYQVMFRYRAFRSSTILQCLIFLITIFLKLKSLMISSLKGLILSGLLPDHKKFKIEVLLLLLCFPLLVIFLVVLLSCLFFWRPHFLPRAVRRKHKFTPSMLKAETDGFSKSNLVRTSAETDIYKGVLRDGSKVRIEIYKTSASRENRRKFVEECRLLIELCHENLVQVLGWCDNRSLKAVVTEWVDEYNVEIWLSTTAPQWKYRVRILMGIIEGMTYLQEGWPQVDYDLKTSSILFSQNEEPMISRFRVDEHYSCTRKIYKFGVLVLEMITNRRPREEFEGKEGSFVEWVRDHYPEDSEEVIDEKLKRTGHDFDHATEALELVKDLGPPFHKWNQQLSTSWTSQHLAFRILDAKPGTSVCHFLATDDIAWLKM